MTQLIKNQAFKKLALTFIAFLTFVSSASAGLALEFHEVDADFLKHNNLRLPVNQKTLVRFNNIPPDIEVVQAVIVNKNNRFRALLLGDPQKEVSGIYFKPYVEFLIEVDEYLNDEYRFQAIELILKGFRKKGEAFEVAEKMKNIVIPTI